MGQPIRIELTRDEALVLFEFLSRHLDDGVHAVNDAAEQQTLWKLQCLLEKQLVEPLLAEYDQLLQQARARILSSDD
jgi:hypothetical protein